jgi:hypothetical protein
MTISTLKDAIAFIEKHGIVLEAGKGVVPSLTEAIVGAPITGSWWAHPKGKLIFSLTRAVRENRENILVCRLVDGKITYVHRNLWAPLVRAAGALDKKNLAAPHEAHTKTGAHRISTVAFPEWVPNEVKEQAANIDEDNARMLIEERCGPSPRTSSERRSSTSKARPKTRLQKRHKA